MVTTLRSDHGRATDQPRRRRRWGPWSLRIFAAWLLLLVGAGGFGVWLPYHREQTVVRRIERWGGWTSEESRAPKWLEYLPARIAQRLSRSEIFNRTDCIYFYAFASDEPCRVNDSGLEAFDTFENLRTITLECPEVTDAGLARLTRITDAGLEHLAGKRELRRLYLEDTSISDAGLIAISRLENLSELYLDRTAITDRGLRNLVGLRNLGRLYLSGTSVTGDGLLQIAGLPALEVVYAARTGVTEESVAEMRRSFPDLSVDIDE